MSRATTILFSGLQPKEHKLGRLEYETVQFEVRVLAEAEGYAMVRRKGCYPFLCQTKELTKVPKEPTK